MRDQPCLANCDDWAGVTSNLAGHRQVLEQEYRLAGRIEDAAEATLAGARKPGPDAPQGLVRAGITASYGPDTTRCRNRLERANAAGCGTRHRLSGTGWPPAPLVSGDPASHFSQAARTP